MKLLILILTLLPIISSAESASFYAPDGCGIFSGFGHYKIKEAQELCKKINKIPKKIFFPQVNDTISCKGTSLVKSSGSKEKYFKLKIDPNLLKFHGHFPYCFLKGKKKNTFKKAKITSKTINEIKAVLKTVKNEIPGKEENPGWILKSNYYLAKEVLKEEFGRFISAEKIEVVLHKVGFSKSDEFNYNTIFIFVKVPPKIKSFEYTGKVYTSNVGGRYKEEFSFPSNIGDFNGDGIPELYFRRDSEDGWEASIFSLYPKVAAKYVYPNYEERDLWK